jgi:hypothetical protein
MSYRDDDDEGLAVFSCSCCHHGKAMVDVLQCLWEGTNTKKDTVCDVEISGDGAYLIRYC